MHIEKRLVSLGHKDTGLGHFVAWAYRVCSNDVVQVFVHFVAAVIASLCSFKDNKWNWGFIVLFYLFYFFLLIIFSVSNRYKKKRETKYDVQQKLNAEIAALLYGMEEETARLNETIRDNLSDKTFSNSKYFETIADNVCVSIFLILCNLFGNDRFKVSVFQQYKKDDHLWVKMIAEKSSKLDRADSYQQEYQIDIEDKESLPFFCRVFFKSDQECAILPTEEEIREQFIKIKGHKINTKQYIGVVGKINLETVGFVLQICTYTRGQFGGKKDMEHFFSEVLLSYREVLRVAYHQRLLQETFVDLL